MRTLGLLLALFITTITVNAQKEKKAETFTVTVTIDNVLNDNGTVMAGLHSSETFMRGSGLQDKITTIKDGKVTIVFKDVKPGEYAILAMHDENNNKQMDREANGMPKESYCISGSPTPYGPPTFSEAKFNVIDTDLEFALRF
ncbi:DUF2141 domain-containing protein [Cellulophaga omnivescoria]|uniref:DUF2141 domain-containing protein n=1 Tax=Cellulophaga omnivescoria TaxID=1888890 RepID=UPI0009869482|nr:DUF2141 domain-containing protein [Cellulophaga omnivescoria]WBU88697.1 DUF2141 domain-containing protein [Cellulophaga omnivescoria]WKB80672.1 DUF2141 domain-containing protein [Cellulophaga lytica]